MIRTLILHCVMGFTVGVVSLFSWHLQANPSPHGHATNTSSVSPEQKLPTDIPSDPVERLLLAQRAFHESDFELLRPLLEPVLEPASLLPDEPSRIMARQLLGLGFFFEAQQASSLETQAQFIAQAKHQFLELMRESPDYKLDPLVYPASVVELFESVRTAHADELQALSVAKQNTPSFASPGENQTLYIERQVQTRPYVLNYAPLGVGQFQNGSPLKGTLFAIGQAVALGLNITSYWMIESLRGSDGRFETHGSIQGGDYARALGWRRMQYGTLAAFSALYLWSVVDALVYFEPLHVHIRTLDQPPIELLPAQPSYHESRAPIFGGSLHMRW